jgi:hypothetical protein
MRATRWFWILVAAGAFGGCMGEAALDDEPTGSSGQYEACTDTLKCCPQAELKCTGDPDKMICSCESLWDCSKNPKKCEQARPVPGDGTWTCTWTATTYTCVGKPSGTPPGGNGWTCVKKGADTVCTKTSPPNPSNKPDGGSVWKCTVDNESKTITCEKGSTPPPTTTTPPTTTPPPPSSGTECVVGQKMWCDGEVYCGWGQVVCGADGRWKRKGFLGLGGLDCQELADGRRPNTLCACYHTFFNATCCETSDCVVPAGTNGQICAPAAGKLCDYCNAQSPSCTAPGGQCIITNSGETFCGQGCSVAQPCPSGYKCMTLSTKSGTTSQCVPGNLSCFFKP